MGEVVMIQFAILKASDLQMKALYVILHIVVESESIIPSNQCGSEISEKN